MTKQKWSLWHFCCLSLIFIFSINSVKGNDFESPHPHVEIEPYYEEQVTSPRLPQNEISYRLSSFSLFQNSAKRNLGWSLTVFIIAGAAATAFTFRYLELENKSNSEYRPIAAGGGAAIKLVLFPLICLPAAKMLMSHLQNNSVTSWLGFHRRIDLHKAIAALFAVAAVVHTVAWIANSSDVLESQEGLTGIAMWVGLLGPVLGSYLVKDLNCLRSPSYVGRFIRPHQLGFVLFSVGYAVHLPSLRLLPWISIPFGIFALDRLIQCTCYRYKNIDGVEGKIGGDKVIMFVPRPAQLNLESGEYFYLKIGKSYHPFTTAWFDSEFLVFVIGKSGGDTQRLFQAAHANGLSYEGSLSMRGPFSSAFQETKSTAEIITISSGSGVSVTTAILRRLMEEKKNQEITVIHSERCYQSFSFLIDKIAQAKTGGVLIRSVHLFLTGETEGAVNWLKEEVENGGMTFSLLPSRDDSVPLLQEGPDVFLHFGRLDLSSLGPNERLRSEFLSQKAHVFISGNPNFSKSVAQFCKLSGIKYTKEAFEF